MVNCSGYHSDLVPSEGLWAVFYSAGGLSGREDFEVLYDARFFCKRLRKLCRSRGESLSVEIKRARIPRPGAAAAGDRRAPLAG